LSVVMNHGQEYSAITDICKYLERTVMAQFEICNINTVISKPRSG